MVTFNLSGGVAYASSSVGQDIGSGNIELTKDEEGNFVGRSTITKPGTNAVDVAVVDIYLRKDITISNLYTVAYNVVSTDLVSGLAASSITIRNSNILADQTPYYSRSLSHTFVSSLLTYGDNGAVIIPPDVTKVKIKTKGLKVYWDTAGWLSATNVNKTEEVN